MSTIGRTMIPMDLLPIIGGYTQPLIFHLKFKIMNCDFDINIDNYYGVTSTDALYNTLCRDQNIVCGLLFLAWHDSCSSVNLELSRIVPAFDQNKYIPEIYRTTQLSGDQIADLLNLLVNDPKRTLNGNRNVKFKQLPIKYSN